MKIPRIESLVLIFCFLAIVVWAVSKCNARRAKVTQADGVELENRPTKRDTVFIREQPAATTAQAPVQYTTPQGEPYKLPANPGEIGQNMPQERTVTTQPVRPAAAPTTTAKAPSAAQQTVVKNQTTLWVTIDGLNMRKEPGLKADLVAKLDLYDQVYFMNEKSDYTQEINLGREMVTDYWVKVKTKSGKVGWVFGAGVHYYKQRRKGTLE
jgi:Bacterial SH3 domain